MKVPYLGSASDSNGSLVYFKWWNENGWASWGQTKKWEHIQIKMEGDSLNWDICLPESDPNYNENCPYDQIWTTEGFLDDDGVPSTTNLGTYGNTLGDWKIDVDDFDEILLELDYTQDMQTWEKTYKFQVIAPGGNLSDAVQIDNFVGSLTTNVDSFLISDIEQSAERADGNAGNGTYSEIMTYTGLTTTTEASNFGNHTN